MHPAFSVLLFTTLSGAGYGLLAWTMLLLAFERPGALMGSTPLMFLGLIGAATLLFTAGLLSSLSHLGQPQRHLQFGAGERECGFGRVPRDRCDLRNRKLRRHSYGHAIESLRVAQCPLGACGRTDGGGLGRGGCR